MLKVDNIISLWRSVISNIFVNLIGGFGFSIVLL